MDLTEKVAIVTGAGQGIGRATSLELAKAGAQLVLADLKEDSLANLQVELQPLNAKVAVVRADVSKGEDAQAMAKLALDTFGRIDILVNNAGITSPRGAWHMSTLDLDDQEWDRVLGVNLKGQFHCAKAVMPCMMSRRSGRIVNVSSSVAFTGSVGSAAYCASKAGVLGLTKVLARELGPYNICVNAVAPGLTMTAMQDGIPPEVIAMVEKTIPLGRAGQPVDIARAILSLVTNDLFLTGQTLIVDGGGTMR